MAETAAAPSNPMTTTTNTAIRTGILQDGSADREYGDSVTAPPNTAARSVISALGSDCGVQDLTQLGCQLNDAAQGFGRMRGATLLRLCDCHRFGQLTLQLGDALGDFRLHHRILPRPSRLS